MDKSDNSMKKVLSSLLGLTILLGSLITPVSSYVSAQEEVKTEEEITSFEMFWPISAGKTSGDSLYFLKSLKESAREKLIFSEYRKADFNITLAEKRAIELEKLLSNKDIVNANKTLEMSKTKRAKVQSYLKALEGKGTNTKDLRVTFKNSLEKQKKLFTYNLSKSTDDKEKEVINSFISSLDSDISSIK